MIKRPLDKRFGAKVLAGVKRSTIRDKVWPMGVPIMLYSWPGRAYEKGVKHIDVAVVMVQHVEKVILFKVGDEVKYSTANGQELTKSLLAEVEGFGSVEEMDAWFRPLVPAEGCEEKWMHTFKLVRAAD